MKTLIRKFYVIGTLVVVVIALGLYLQFNYFNKIFISEAEKGTTYWSYSVGNDISNNLLRKGQVVTDIADYIQLGNWDKDDLLAYMKGLMNSNPYFSSIYYGTTENVMINGSGWVPSKNFDLRTRPWYLKAVNEKKLIFTEAFVNASKDKLIITIAKPVYNSNNQLLGVIAGDVSIKDIISIVQQENTMGKGYSFLIDGNSNIFAHPKYEYDLISNLKSVKEISEELDSYISDNKLGINKIILEGIDGYLAYHPIANTDWKIASFIPLDEYTLREEGFWRIFIITLLSSLAVFIIFLLQQKKHFITPMIALSDDIQKINLEEDITYRLPSDEKDIFAVLRKSINHALNKIQELFYQVEAKEAALTAANAELEYLSYHDVLTGLHNRRFFEEELVRLDASENYPLTILMADVNGLKLVNDSFGHSMGDELLVKVAESIKKGCRTYDVSARLGGDEFVVLLPKTNGFEAEQIIKGIKAAALKEDLGSIDISISFGYDTKEQEEENIRDILKKAEDYMYKKKLYESPSMRGKTIKAIINTLNEKNKREEQHSQRVSVLCKHMGEVIGLAEGEVQELITVGLLHDIGKIAIDESILNKAGNLTEDEWEEMKRHPEIGYRILSTVNDMSEMAEYVLSHHEKWDGTGYPKGLKGEEIPLQSRILSIADAYDAMTSERSYRISMSKEEAIMELKNYAGLQFDPELIKVFIEMADI